MYDELLEQLPSHLAWRVLTIEDQESATVIERCYRALLADRALMVGMRGTPRTMDRQAKRTVLHAMALVAATKLERPIGPLAERWGYPREHLYRAAGIVAESLETDWWAIREPLEREGLWPYNGGFVLEIIGAEGRYPAPASIRHLVSALPVPLAEAAIGDETRMVIGRNRTRMPAVQVAVDAEPTREDALVLKTVDNAYTCGRLVMTPLEVLQRAYEVRLIQQEMEAFNQALAA